MNKLFAVILGFAMALMPLLGQTITADVALEAQRLLPEEQDILRELPNRLEAYVNDFEWTTENEDIPLNLRMGIIIETITARGSEKLFRGQFQITSPSGENYVDKSVEFTYQKGQFLDHNRGQFDPLLGMIDFYVYMVIAGELDAYLLQGGGAFYAEAKRVGQEAQVSNFQTGWRSRIEDVNQITDADHLPLREAKFYFYEGLFYLEKRNDAERVPQYAKKFVDLLHQVHKRKPNSAALKRFLDSHFQEICSLFTFDKDAKNANLMKLIDNRRSEVYDRCGKDNGRKRRI